MSQDISDKKFPRGHVTKSRKVSGYAYLFRKFSPEKFGRSCYTKLPSGKVWQKFQIRNVDGKLSPDPDMSRSFGEHFRQIPTCYTKFRRTLSPDPDM
jgi:hypothetical protein